MFNKVLWGIKWCRVMMRAGRRSVMFDCLHCPGVGIALGALTLGRGRAEGSNPEAWRTIL